MAKPIIPTVEGTKVELGFDHEVREALKAFVEASEAKARAEKIKKEAEAILRAKIGTAEVATIGGAVAFKLMYINKREVDRDKLNLYPEVAQEVFYDNPYQFIKALRIQE